MQVIGICRFSYPGEGGFQVEHRTLAERIAYLYAPERMAQRFASFETMTLPPLRAQSDADFTLLVVIGDSLPPEYRARLEHLLADLPQAVMVARPPGPHRQVMQAAINEQRRIDGAPCLQFRMDDDDAVSVDFVAELRAAAQQVRGLLQRHRHVAIDFNQGYIARPGAPGLEVAPTQAPYTTAALALMLRPELQLSVMNFAHRKLAQKMPTLTFTGRDMLIRGYNAFNDSRQKPGMKTPHLALLDAAGERHIKARFNIDNEAVKRAFSPLQEASSLRSR
ncbi:putative rhamnosyl transferase [Sulfitobacter aestuarii]|uniref:Rhamnosyl transferase n=1 Tax=Sulfitobacter aestuarii TaxID=2161676 RepID=A0ABW5TYT3_9RHOB